MRQSEGGREGSLFFSSLEPFKDNTSLSPHLHALEVEAAMPHPLLPNSCFILPLLCLCFSLSGVRAKYTNKNYKYEDFIQERKW